MELDFDKEIDALIRREAAGRTITISERSGMHLDADEIAAFYEGAVPDQARQTFMRHFAECDHCRQMLSHMIVLRGEESAEASQGVAAPVGAASPWYRKLFLFPNLAYVMGGLVFLFAGFIGVSVLTYRSGQLDLSKVSQEPAVSDSRPMESAPFANANSSTASSANTMANASSNAANAAPAGVPAMPSSNSVSNTAVDKETLFSRDDAEKPKDAEPLAVAPAPPPPAKSESFAVDGLSAKRAQESRPAPIESDRKPEESKIVPQATPAQPRGPAPKIKGPMRNESRERSIALEAERNRSMDKADVAAGSAANTSAGGRSVAGRTFVFRQGAWYDTTYRGQGTINVRRNTNDYQKLDRGLRSLAESFMGTVVVTIWNGRAYRIQ